MQAAPQELPVITVETTVNSTPDNVWNCFTQPDHIKNWNFASDDWHAPSAESDFRKKGRFNYTMAAKDGSAGFDFSGTFTDIVDHERIDYILDDGRKVDVAFNTEGDGVKIIQKFEAESQNSLDLQRDGWQAILNNFKKYAENQG